MDFAPASLSGPGPPLKGAGGHSGGGSVVVYETFPEREVASSNDVLLSVLLRGLLKTLECCESELPIAEELRVGTLVPSRRQGSG